MHRNRGRYSQKNIRRKEEIELLNKVIKRIDEWWIRRNTIQLPDNYIHVEGNLSKGLRMDAHAEGFTMGQKIKLTKTEVNENERA